VREGVAESGSYPMYGHPLAHAPYPQHTQGQNQVPALDPAADTFTAEADLRLRLHQFKAAPGAPLAGGWDRIRGTRTSSVSVQLSPHKCGDLSAKPCSHACLFPPQISKPHQFRQPFDLQSAIRDLQAPWCASVPLPSPHVDVAGAWLVGFGWEWL